MMWHPQKVQINCSRVIHFPNHLSRFKAIVNVNEFFYAVEDAEHAATKVAIMSLCLANSHEASF